MDGKGAWRDNVFVERLWRTVKYEEVYLRAYAGVSASPRLDRPVSELLQRQEAAFVLGGKTPDQAYFNRRRKSRRQPEMGGRAHLETAKVFRQTEPPLATVLLTLTTQSQRTTSTGRVVWVRTFIVSLPRSMAETPRRPCEAMTIKSHRLASAISMMIS